LVNKNKNAPLSNHADACVLSDSTARWVLGYVDGSQPDGGLNQEHASPQIENQWSPGPPDLRSFFINLG